MTDAPNIDLADYRAAADIHHRFLTGIILTLVMRKGEANAAETIYRMFLRHHSEKFVPGLELLGLTDLPDAVASAQYHYLSNFLGTVKVEYMYESDRKAWIRYPPPRWIFDGTAICGVPDAVTKAIMRGWHARNGEALGNPRLCFVCTGMTTAGDPGLEGYFFEDDRPLEPDERLRFAPDETAPPFDPSAAPEVDAATWPAERLAKAERNYSTDHVRTILQVMIGLFGPDETRALAGHAGRLVGMQYYDEIRERLGIADTAAEGFAAFMTRLGQAMGDGSRWRRADGAILIEQSGCRLIRGVEAEAGAAFDAWAALWAGACSVHDRRLSLILTTRPEAGGGPWSWRLS